MKRRERDKVFAPAKASSGLEGTKEVAKDCGPIWRILLHGVQQAELAEPRNRR